MGSQNQEIIKIRKDSNTRINKTRNNRGDESIKYPRSSRQAKRHHLELEPLILEPELKKLPKSRGYRNMPVGLLDVKRSHPVRFLDRSKNISKGDHLKSLPDHEDIQRGEVKNEPPRTLFFRDDKNMTPKPNGGKWNSTYHSDRLHTVDLVPECLPLLWNARRRTLRR